MNNPSVSRPVARIAAQWFLRLQYEQPSAEERQAFELWRAASEENERAWLLAAQVTHQLKTLPRTLSRDILQRPATVSRRTALGALSSLIVLGSVGLGLPRTQTYGALTADLRTGVGEVRHIKLADGTVISLNTDSAVDIQYNDTQRRLTLRKGELFVATASDHRPMVVDSSYGTFIPQGTRFSVRQFDDHDLLHVAQGSVIAAVQGAPDIRLLVVAGGQARVTRTNVLPLTAAPSVDWVNGVLRVNRMRLADVIKELGRYRAGWLRCAEEVADLQISGAFQLNDIDAALAALALSFPVQVRYVTNYWVTVLPA